MSRLTTAVRIAAAAALVTATLIGASASTGSATDNVSDGCAALNATPTATGTTGTFTQYEFLILAKTSGSKGIILNGTPDEGLPERVIPSTGVYTVSVADTEGSWSWSCLPASADVSGRVLVNGTTYDSAGTNAVTFRVGDSFSAAYGAYNDGPGVAVNYAEGTSKSGSVPPTVCLGGGPSQVGPYLLPEQFSGWFPLTQGSCTLSAAGVYTFSVTAGSSTPDPISANNVASVTVTVLPQFTFTGFYKPVDNTPLINTMKAGAAVPVKFSLGGDRGLGIFAEGFPTSEQVVCDSTAPTDQVELTLTAGGSTLTYDALTGTYSYVWKTAKAWKGTCRQLTVKFVDGTTQTALFKLQ